jgi:hypothetical protein
MPSFRRRCATAERVMPSSRAIAVRDVARAEDADRAGIPCRDRPLDTDGPTRLRDVLADHDVRVPGSPRARTPAHLQRGADRQAPRPAFVPRTRPSTSPVTDQAQRRPGFMTRSIMLDDRRLPLRILRRSSCCPRCTARMELWRRTGHRGPPIRIRRRRRQDLPGSRGTLACVPCSPTPVGPPRSATAALRCCLPQFRHRRLPREP